MAKRNQPRRARRARCRAAESAASDGRDDRDGLAGGPRGGQPVEEADVLVGEEDVDEPAELAGVVEEALGETGVAGVEGLQRLADRRPVDLDLAGAGGQGAQLGGDADGHAHRAGSSVIGKWWSGSSAPSTAAWKASRVGSIVTVGPAVPARASTVFSPCPVTRAAARSSRRTTPSAAGLARVAIVTPPAVSAK